jgi:hypothetical protein
VTARSFLHRLGAGFELIEAALFVALFIEEARSRLLLHLEIPFSVVGIGFELLVRLLGGLAFTGDRGPLATRGREFHREPIAGCVQVGELAIGLAEAFLQLGAFCLLGRDLSLQLVCLMA